MIVLSLTLRNCQIVSHKGCAILLFPGAMQEGSLSLHPYHPCYLPRLLARVKPRPYCLAGKRMMTEQ